MWKNKHEEKKNIEKKGSSINLDDIFGSEFESHNPDSKMSQNNTHFTKIMDTPDDNDKNSSKNSNVKDVTENKKKVAQYADSKEKAKGFINSAKDPDNSGASIKNMKELNGTQNAGFKKPDSMSIKNRFDNSTRNIDDSGDSVEFDKDSNRKQKTSFRKHDSRLKDPKFANSTRNIDDSGDSVEINNDSNGDQKKGFQNFDLMGTESNSSNITKNIDYSDESIKIDKEMNAKHIKNVNNLFLVSEYTMCFQECKTFLDNNTNLFCILLKVNSCKNFQELIEKLRRMGTSSETVGLSLIKFLFGVSRYASLSEDAISKNNDALINLIDRIKQLNKYILAVAKKNQETKMKIQDKQSASGSNEVTKKNKKIPLGGQILSDISSIPNVEPNISAREILGQIKKSNQEISIDEDADTLPESIKSSKQNSDVVEKTKKETDLENQKETQQKTEPEFDSDADLNVEPELQSGKGLNTASSDILSSDINPENELLDFIENDEGIEESKTASMNNDSATDFPFGFYLNYFDAVRGPKTFYELSISPDPSITDEILDTMNKNHGYYVLEVNQFIIYSFLFEIPSEVSRGKIDLLQYAICVNANLFDVKGESFSPLIRKYFTKAGQFFQNNKEIYLALWYGREDSKPDIDKQKIRMEYLKLMRITSELEAKVLTILNSNKNKTNSVEILESEPFKNNYIKKLSEVLDLVESISKSS